MFKKKPHTVMIPRKVALIRYKVVIRSDPFVLVVARMLAR